MNIDGSDLIVGRVATVAAKKALLGEKVVIVNCEKMVLTGKRQELLARHKKNRDRGIHTKGPFYSRLADRYVRRMIRGMLPHRQPRGRDAYENIMCYVGVPEEFKDQKMETIKEAHISKMDNLKFMTIGELTHLLGGKNE